MDVSEIAALLKSQRKTVSLAEGSTAGLITYTLGSVPGASNYLTGGVVAYDYSVKMKVLGVSEKLLLEKGAVSKEVVLDMARRVRGLMDTDVGISSSGIAGPTGGTPQKPVGLFYVALAAREGLESWEKLHLHTDREGNARQASLAALELLRRYLQEIARV